MSLLLQSFKQFGLANSIANKNLEYMDIEMVPLPAEYQIPSIATAHARPPSALVRPRRLPPPQAIVNIGAARIGIDFIRIRPRTLEIFILSRMNLFQRS